MRTRRPRRRSLRIRSALQAFTFVALFPLIAGMSDSSRGEPTCSYSTYEWNVPSQRAVNHRAVRHSYASLAPEEIDAGTGCTVCREDQTTLHLPDGTPYEVCHLLAPAIAEAVDSVVASGEPIFTITGYRVGMTKGETDANGNRTRFSNHSFGIALDVNEELNGLYDRCIAFGPDCRLIRGGRWEAGQLGSLTPESAVVRELGRIGLRWGGRIEGRQKDFMHFSPTGY